MNKNSQIIIQVSKQGEDFICPIEVTTIKELFNAATEKNIDSLLYNIEGALRHFIEIKKIEAGVNVESFIFDNTF